MDNLSNKKILILGYSVTGIAAAKYFISKNADVCISESKAKEDVDIQELDELLNKGVKVEFSGHSDEFINNSEFCILSPSIPPEAEILTRLKEKNIPYMSDIEYVSKFDSDKMIVTTGTNGKTTTTALISHVLSSKFNIPYCGNIGVSPMEYFDKNVDYYSIEASSFQLFYSPTLAPKIGIFCNLTPDHILWH